MEVTKSSLLQIYTDLNILPTIKDPAEMRLMAQDFLDKVNYYQEQYPLVQELDDIELFVTRIIDISFLEEPDRNAMLLLIIEDYVRRRRWLEAFWEESSMAQKRKTGDALFFFWNKVPLYTFIKILYCYLKSY